MADDALHFENFVLDCAGRRLTRDGATVELNARYFDALALMAREQGALVSKERFLEEVWRGTPVTDEALTQCIRTLRRRLGDDASRPRFIETVPKHGYRFIAPVSAGDALDADGEREPEAAIASPGPRGDMLVTGVAGTLGGGAAGAIGGLFYSVVTAASPSEAGIGAASSLLVLVCLTMLVGLAGGAGVGFGMAAAALAPGRRALWTVLGGAGGGLLVGAIARLVGLDAFNLLLGQSPGDITGAFEGAVLGGAVGLSVWLAERRSPPGRPFSRGLGGAALAGGCAGILIHVTGGRLMAGSLDLVARRFPQSRLHLDQIGALFGEAGFGPVSQLAVTALEGALFAMCVLGAIMLARRPALTQGRGAPEPGRKAPLRP